MFKMLDWKNFDNWKFWISLAIIVKLFLFTFFYFDQSVEIAGFIGKIAGDSYSYLTPIDNLLDHGSYSPDYRMPGYGVLYFLFRLFVSVVSSYNAIVILQLLIGAVSVYFLAKMSYLLFQSHFIFYATYFGYLISTYVSVFDFYLLTESLSTSITIIMTYSLLLFFYQRSLKQWMIAAFLFVWLVFLKPVYFPLLLVPVFLLFLLRKEINKGKLFKLLFLFLLPFLLIDGVWTVRNYQQHEKFFPFYNGFLYPGYEEMHRFHIMKFVQAFGGNYVWWDPSAEMRWFNVTENLHGEDKSLVSKNVKLPDYIYTKDFNEDSLKVIADYVHRFNEHEFSPADSIKYNAYLIEKLTHYRTSFKEKKPFHYYVLGPLNSLQKFVVHSGTYNLFSKPAEQLSIFKYAIKMLYSLLYVFVVALGGLGLLWLIRKHPIFDVRSTIIIICSYTLIIFPFVFRFCEARYFVPIYPFMLMSSMVLLEQLLKRLGIKW